MAAKMAVIDPAASLAYKGAIGLPCRLSFSSRLS
jgi:hypothetical protein